MGRINVLFIPDDSPDYMADFVFHGFATNPDCKVFLSHAKASLSVQPEVRAQQEAMDCFLPLDPFVLPSPGAAQYADVVILGSIRQQALRRYLDLAQYVHARPVAILDGEDSSLNQRLPMFQFIDKAAGPNTPRFYFKREYLLCDPDPQSHPLPFCYPDTPIDHVGEPMGVIGTPALAAFHVWPHDEDCGRMHSRRALAKILARWGGARMYITDEASKHRRLSPVAYHRLLQQTAISVSPAGAGYHCNRHLEVICYGNLPLLPAPWVAWASDREPQANLPPEIPVYRNMHEVPDILEELQRDMAAVEERWRKASAWFRRHHSTVARSNQILALLKNAQ